MLKGKVFIIYPHPVFGKITTLFNHQVINSACYFQSGGVELCSLIPACQTCTVHSAQCIAHKVVHRSLGTRVEIGALALSTHASHVSFGFPLWPLRSIQSRPHYPRGTVPTTRQISLLVRCSCDQSGIIIQLACFDWDSRTQTLTGVMASNLSDWRPSYGGIVAKYSLEKGYL